ncbi:MAG: Mov34/MPN/PAD-1 family protein [Candidatus Micrarchaeota archaeon]
MVNLERKVLLSAMQGAKNVFPNEFIALFQKTEKGHMLIIPPFSEYGATFSSFDQWALPPMNIIGSFHSHPSGNGEPSQQDLLFFSKTADFNIVAFPPFSLTSFKAFSSEGKKIRVKII